MADLLGKPSIIVDLGIYWNVMGWEFTLWEYTLWWFYISIEHGSFIDDKHEESPIKNAGFPLLR